MIKRTLFLALFLLGTSSAQVVTKVGTTAGQFLKIGVGSRAAAMGEAFVAVADDISALYWNTAGLAAQRSLGFIFVNSEWLAETRFSYAGVVAPLGARGVIGASVTYFGTDDMPVRTEEEPMGTGEVFRFTNLAVGVSWAQYLTDRFSIGLQAKYISENLWKMHSGTFAVDIGLLFVTQFNDWRIGMNFSNFGGKLRLVGENTAVIYDIDPDGDPPPIVADLRTEYFDLPLRFQVGIAGYLFQTNMAKLLLAIDAVHPNDNSEYVNVGAELSLLDVLYLRGGHRTLFMRDREGGLSFGGGLRLRPAGSPLSFQVDFSYTDYGRLKSAKRVSLQLNL